MPQGTDFQCLRDEIDTCFNVAGLNLLIEQPGRVRPEALGRNARFNPPSFWQLAGWTEAPGTERRLLSVQTRLEENHPIHFASLSSYTVVYKVRGSVEILSRYYPDLQDRDYDTSMALCHARYSTNTASSFERAQPFALIGHNGEINTISRLRQEAAQIGAALPYHGSDSQDLDRTLHALCVDYGLDLIEAMEMIFPPVPHELGLLPSDLRSVYTRVRQSFGPYAQGPAAVVARYGDVAVSSMDALGLRPLRFVETEKEYIFCSERGAVRLENTASDARPLAPGEKMALRVNRGRNIEVLPHAQIRQHVLSEVFRRETSQPDTHYWMDWGGDGKHRPPPLPPSGLHATEAQVFSRGVAAQTATEPRLVNVAVHQPSGVTWNDPDGMPRLDTAILAANGWHREHLREIEALTSTGKDLVGSLGYDGPLAVLSRNRVNLADFYKETVAVVSNPSIDRGREGEAFSSRVLIGARPAIGKAPNTDNLLAVLETPLLPGGHPSLGSQEVAQEVARRLDTLTIEQLVGIFEGRVAWLTLGVLEGEDVPAALARLADEAIEAVRAGAQCLVIDDSATPARGLGWLDPHLATGHIDESLRKAGGEVNLRRRTGIVVRSASVRTLHDIALLYGFGADAINPYAMLGVALNVHKGHAPEDEEEQIQSQYRLLNILRKGLEKVISTTGCHELRGYGRVCSAIGLAPSLAETLKSPNYFGSEGVGLTWERLSKEAAERSAELRSEVNGRQLSKTDRFLPKFWKKVAAYAEDEIGYDELSQTFQRLEAETPVALRHVLGVKRITDIINPADVDISIDGYNLPLVIGAMSFGSQGELAYKAYAQAAATLNIICMNGEGGELPEMMGIYKRNRGQQVASGRFGVNAEF